jgi:K+-sensing histidine kinase KdpD
MDTRGDHTREALRTEHQPGLSPHHRIANERNIRIARAERAHVDVLDGKDPVATMQKVTQIFVTRQRERTLRTWLTEGLAQQIVNLAHDMQVTVVADRSSRKPRAQ